ncbi:MAG: PAS domain-containing protein, partial [Proteobacteria bacterium]|nr:PAS domain-containing protein [Pseudomonadota bacterium]
MVKTGKKKPLDFGPEAGLTPSREGADNFQRIINDTMVDGLVVIDEKGIVLNINKAGAEMFGYSEEEIIGNNVNMLMNPYDNKHHGGYLSKYLKTGKGKIIGIGPREVAGRRKDGTEIALELAVNSHKEEGGGIIFVGSLRDITKRKETEAALLELQEKLHLITENTTDIIILRDANGKLRYISSSAERELKYKKEDFIGTLGWQDIIHPDDRDTYVSLWKQRVLVEGKLLTAEMRMRDGEGIYHWYESDSRPVKNDAGKVEHVVTVVRNITERKEVEAENLRLVNIVEDSLNEIYVLSPKTLKFNYVNKQARKNLGYSMEELKQMTPADLGANRSLKKIKEIFNSLENKQEEKIRFEGRNKRKDGSVYDIELNAWLSEAGESPVYVVIIDDITEKKAAEAAVKEAEAQYKMLADHGTDIVILEDTESKVIYVSPSLKRHLGIDPEETVGKNSWDMVHPDDRKETRSDWKKVVLGEKKPCTSRLRFQHADGQYIWFESLCTPVLNEAGKVTAVISTNRNISEQHEAEEKLELVTKNMSDMIFLFDTAGKILFVSPSIKSQLGWTIDERLGGTCLDILHPEDKPLWPEWKRDVMEKGNPFTARVRYRHKDGSYCWFESHTQPIKDERGRVTAAVTASRNITEQRKAEEQMAENERLLRTVLNSAGEGVYGVDLKGRTTFANHAAIKILGYSLNEMLGMSQHDLIHHHYPDGTKYPRKDCNIYRAFSDGKIHRVEDEVFWHKKGTAIPVEYTSSPIHDEDGNLAGAVVVFRDITQRVKDEAARKEAEEKLKMLAENTSDIITLRDSSGKVIYITPSFEKQLGYNSEKEKGKNPRLEIIHPDDRGKLELWEKRVYREGKPFRTNLRLKPAQGEYLWFESHTEPVKDEKGQVIAAVTTSHNITEYKKAESEALRLGRIVEDSLNEVYVFDAKTLKFLSVNRG